MFSENNVAMEHKKVTPPSVEDAEAGITRRILDNLTSKGTQSSILETMMICALRTLAWVETEGRQTEPADTSSSVYY